jgi:hypothetical protein
MLRAAVIKGDLEEARKHAHEDPCEPNAEDSGLTCHHYAAQYNCLPVLLFLRELPDRATSACAATQALRRFDDTSGQARPPARAGVNPGAHRELLLSVSRAVACV